MRDLDALMKVRDLGTTRCGATATARCSTSTGGARPPRPRAALRRRRPAERWAAGVTDEDHVEQRHRERPGPGAEVLHGRARVRVKTDMPAGEHRWLTVASPEGVAGVELLLEPDAHPAAREFQKALHRDGIPRRRSSRRTSGASTSRLVALGVTFRDAADPDGARDGGGLRRHVREPHPAAPGGRGASRETRRRAGRARPARSGLSAARSNARTARERATRIGFPGRDDPSLRRVAEDWREAYDAGDAPRVAALYTEHGQYLSAHVGARGREAIRAYFQRGIDAGGRIEAIRVLESRSDGTLRLRHGHLRAKSGSEGRRALLLVLEEMR